MKCMFTYSVSYLFTLSYEISLVMHGMSIRCFSCLVFAVDSQGLTQRRSQKSNVPVAKGQGVSKTGADVVLHCTATPTNRSFFKKVSSICSTPLTCTCVTVFGIAKSPKWRILLASQVTPLFVEKKEEKNKQNGMVCTVLFEKKKWDDLIFATLILEW